MPDYLGRPRLKSDYQPAIKYNYNREIPIQFEFEYFKRLNFLNSYHKDLISAIIPENQTLIFPLNTDLIEKYLSGFRVTYSPFNNSFNRKLQGYYEKDPNVDNAYTVYFNISGVTYKKQRNTCVHETLHICQSLDPFFQTYFDELITNRTFPNKIIIKLLEKATEQATAMYIMPHKYFYNKYHETKSVNELSDYFQASIQSVVIRLKELGLAMPI